MEFTIHERAGGLRRPSLPDMPPFSYAVSVSGTLLPRILLVVRSFARFGRLFGARFLGWFPSVGCEKPLGRADVLIRRRSASCDLCASLLAKSETPPQLAAFTFSSLSRGNRYNLGRRFDGTKHVAWISTPRACLHGSRRTPK